MNTNLKLEMHLQRPSPAQEVPLMRRESDGVHREIRLDRQLTWNEIEQALRLVMAQPEED
jgi:hypothetical protein